MNAQESPDTAPTPFVFSSPEGFALCQRILEAHLPYSPHDFQIEGICKVLDHVDLLAILATGTGKTGFSLCTCLLYSPSRKILLCVQLQNFRITRACLQYAQQNT